MGFVGFVIEYKITSDWDRNQNLASRGHDSTQSIWGVTCSTDIVSAPHFTFPIPAPAAAFTLWDGWDLLIMYLSYLSLPTPRYPSPLHGCRWITRPGLARLTERRGSSENTPLPSYSNAGCPFAHGAHKSREERTDEQFSLSPEDTDKPTVWPRSLIIKKLNPALTGPVSKNFCYCLKYCSQFVSKCLRQNHGQCVQLMIVLLDLLTSYHCFNVFCSF